ncbi:multicopper oxidase domain-containing protein [Noviherbaspirillum pedocola]|uniref:Multicopper oxidase domain-containing protein n=1 Tax=Noviherbaspirillum pedocola TaxID=2801341 RepID=A0A934SVC7_9BURK|nr:multicopper oxidase domain-containing protein [Noviherbaspirillum pedocola]MBK4735831.1 multicopper oxidase domain-containing protein [Noviherbaspirillum pedocola]
MIPARISAAVCRALFAAALAALPATAPHAAVPGIAGPTFNLVASEGRSSQPDGNSIYSWGYGCDGAATTVPYAGGCPLMQIPGPTMIVTEGQTVTVNLVNRLPAAAGNASMVFAGMDVSASGGAPGILAQEATHDAATGKVTYTFVAGKPGTYAYYSGTRPDLQIEMGMYGALIVLPATAQPGCKKGSLSHAASAYDHPATCYDREYLFQFAEMDSRIHEAAEAAVLAGAAGPVSVKTEPYQPNYFLINGRSMPDLMDTSYAPNYPNQPYNANPHMHPGELLLMRVIGQGRTQHPFHFHGNHARVLARDGNLITAMGDTANPPRLAGPLLFTIPTVPGQSVDAIFTWTGQGLNWDAYGANNGHKCNGKDAPSPGFDPDTREYCPDHNKAIPATPADPNIVANGLWYGGTPYLGLQNANNTPLPPGQTRINPGAGYAYMWHSHNEREITTNDVFPGGMMMMMIIDPPGNTIDEKL